MALLLVRHGHVGASVGRCVGHTDVPLSPRGRDEIRRLADSWATPPAALYASDLSRAVVSAEVLGARWRLVPRIDARLRELSFGEWDGRWWTELEERESARLAAWGADWVESGPPGGESFRDLVRRVEGWLAEVRGAALTGDVVAVAHAGTIRAALCALGRVEARRVFEVPIDYAEVVRIDLGGDHRPAISTSRSAAR